MKHTLFVYYKVPQGDHALSKPRVESALAQIQQRFAQLQINLMRRPDVSSEGFETWMEVYHHPEGVSAEMKALLDRAGLVALALRTGFHWQ